MTPTAMQPGTVLADRFRLIALAGTGGMGAVYRAFDISRESEVAVKLLQHPNDTELARRFLREASALQGELRSLRHPGIVEYIDHGITDDGMYYLAMEWLDGRDLETRIHRQSLTEIETIYVGVQLCEALSAVHACDLLHRDIKP
ncbi:MAG: protein kinase, partial [Myxococcota bacterium]